MQQKRKELEAENEEMRAEMTKMTRARENMEYEKAKYMEGAVWFGRKVTNEVEKLCQQVDTMVSEYHYREGNIGVRSSHGSNAFMPKNIGTERNI